MVKLMHSIQSNHIAKINRLQSYQSQIAYWEKSGKNYKRGLQTFQDFMDFLTEFRDPKALVNGYIRMAKYCEKMEDISLSHDLYKTAMQLMKEFGLGDASHVKNLELKIRSLNY